MASRVLGPHAGVVGPHDVLGTRVGAEAARNTARSAAGSGTTSTPPASNRTASISAPIGAAYSVFSDRFRPARSPRLTNFIAILREASSIISSPNITAPLPSPSVAFA